MADSTNRSRLRDINAVGVGDQDRGADDAGRGVMDQPRPCGVVATGTPSAMSREQLSRFDSKRKMTEQKRSM